MKRLPLFLKKYFWDIDFKQPSLPKHRIYILRRILEYGDAQAVSWMENNFDRLEIVNALTEFRGYSRKSANFWAFALEIPKEEVLCLKKPSLKAPKAHWNH
jgi:hypothetical protein